MIDPSPSTIGSTRDNSSDAEATDEPSEVEVTAPAETPTIEGTLWTLVLCNTASQLQRHEAFVDADAEDTKLGIGREKDSEKKTCALTATNPDTVHEIAKQRLKDCT